MTMHAYLLATGHPTAWLDAREVLVVDNSGGGLGEKGSSNVMGTDPLWETTAELVSKWFEDPERSVLTTTDCATAAPIVVVTGFVAATLEGTPTTLKARCAWRGARDHAPHPPLLFAVSALTLSSLPSLFSLSARLPLPSHSG